MPLNPFLQKVYDATKEPPEKAPSDWLLIEAAERAKEELETIRKDIALKEQGLVLIPQNIRQQLDDGMVRKEQMILRLQQELIDDWEQYDRVEQQWIKGKESLEAIRDFYRPQLLSLEAQASYVPLTQRATISRRKKKPKQQKDD